MTERALIQKDFAPVGRHSSPAASRKGGRWRNGETHLTQFTATVRAGAKETRLSYFLSSLPLWLLIAIIVVTPTVLAMGAQILIRKRVGLDKLVNNNEIAGFKFATVGVIYAVLLAFSVIVVWEKFSDAQTSVAEEAGATGALFHYAEGKEPDAVAVRTALANYLTTTIEDEWPAMARETESPVTQHALDSLYDAALALNRSGARTTADMSEVFRQLDNVTAARRVRLHLATGLVPNVIWIVLFTGALLTVGFTLFFGSENLVAQVSMTGVLSVLVTMGLVVIISIDHPFTGPVYIHPELTGSGARRSPTVKVSFSAAAFASPPKAGGRQFNQRAIRIARVEAHPAARPAILANDVRAAFAEPLAPGVDIIGADRECEVEAPAAIVPGNCAAQIDDVLLGCAGLKHQQDATSRDLEGDQPRRIDKSFEPEQGAIKRRGAFEVSRVEGCFQHALDRRRAVLLRHRLLRTPSIRSGGHCDGTGAKSPNVGFREARRFWPFRTRGVRRRLQACRPRWAAGTRSGTREAKWLEIIMPGIEPTSSETSIWKSTDQCPAPAMRLTGKA